MRISVVSLIRATTRVGLVSLDQVISSLSNLLISVIATHMLTPRDFGAFGIVFATYMLVVFLVRSATGEVLLLTDRQRAADNAGSNLAIAAVLGVAAGILVALAGLLTGGKIGAGLLPLAIGLAGLTLQDCIRYVGFAARRVSMALTCDLIWLFFVAAFFLLVRPSAMTVGELAALWVSGGVIAAVSTLLFYRIRVPSISSLKLWIRDKKHLMINLAADRGLVSGGQHSVIYIIAIMIGLEGNAAYRAAQTIMGPVNILLVGISTATIPYLVQTWSKKPHKIVRYGAIIGGATGLAFLAITQAIAIIPNWAGAALAGQSWTLAKPILPIMGLIIAIQGPNFVALGALRVMGNARSAVAVRILVVPLTIGAVAGAAAFGDLVLLMWVQAGCTASASLIWWILAWRTKRRNPPLIGNASCDTVRASARIKDDEG